MSAVQAPWLTQTKFISPRRREDLVPRRRLLDGLHAAVNARALTLVSAPRGYGLITWLQSRVAPIMRGRIMSLMMFASVELNPISTALAGVFIGMNATAFLVSAGILMTGLSLLGAYSPAIRKMSM